MSEDFVGRVLHAPGEWVPNERRMPDGELVRPGERKILSADRVGRTTITTQVWRGGPFLAPPFDFATGHVRGLVLQGSASVHLLDTDGVLGLRAGDWFAFDAGTNTQWEYHEPFVKYEVIVLNS